METDHSARLHQLYLLQKNKQVEVHLKNGQICRGVFSGFTRSEETDGTCPITQWQLTNESEGMITGIDAFGFEKGTIIKQEDIMKVKFSHTVIKFY